MERDSSEQLDQLAAALCKAQASISDAKKDGKNPHLNRSYATLASVWDACREPLTSNGLCVVQRVLPGEPGRIRLETVLLHNSGQFICGIEDLPLTKANDPQAYGAALTYARRYGLSAMVGVCPEEDLDSSTQGSGNRANPPQQQRQQSRPTGSERSEQAVRNTERPPAAMVANGNSRPEPPAEDLQMEQPGGNSDHCCETEGCGKPMTPGQITMSRAKFGQHLFCPACQKDQASRFAA